MAAPLSILSKRERGLFSRLDKEKQEDVARLANLFALRDRRFQKSLARMRTSPKDSLEQERHRQVAKEILARKNEARASIDAILRGLFIEDLVQHAVAAADTRLEQAQIDKEQAQDAFTLTTHRH